MQLNSYLKELLQKIGLTEAEAELYLKASENPKATLSHLQKKTGLSRATVYRSFEKLHDLKLVTSSPQNWRKNIEAVSLRTLTEQIGKEQRKLRKIELQLKGLANLHELGLKSYSQDPIEIYTDQNQITEHCYKIINAPWNHIECFGSAERLYEIAGEKPGTDFVSMRVRKGRSCDAVFTELGNHTKDLLKKNETELRNGRLFVDQQNQHHMTYIYNDEVTIWNKNVDFGKRAIVIRDPVLSGMYRNLFRNFSLA